MGLFGGKEAKEEKQEQAVTEIIERNGLDQFVTGRDMAERMASADKIYHDAYLGIKPEDKVMIEYLKIIAEQNFMIIQKLYR